MPEDLARESLDPKEEIECISDSILITHQQIENLFNNQDQSEQQEADAARHLGLEDSAKIKRFHSDFFISYVVHTPFKLSFSWAEIGGQTIDCSICAPQMLQLVKIPISIDCIAPTKNTLKLEQPIDAKYCIKNLSEDHVFECVALLDDQSKYFFSSGEIRTRFDIMPLDEVILEYQLFPLSLGHHDLPKLHIIDRSANAEALKLQFRKLGDPTYI